MTDKDRVIRRHEEQNQRIWLSLSVERLMRKSGPDRYLDVVGNYLEYVNKYMYIESWPMKKRRDRSSGDSKLYIIQLSVLYKANITRDSNTLRNLMDTMILHLEGHR